MKRTKKKEVNRPLLSFGMRSEQVLDAIENNPRIALKKDAAVEEDYKVAK